MTDKHFDPRVLGTITSGTMLVPAFSEVHEAIEHIVGHQVWTHEMADVWKTVCLPAILAKYPEMPQEHPADFRQCGEDLLKRYGPSVPMPAGTGKRTADPVTTFSDAMRRAKPCP
jgi:hypothetical protein